MLRRIKELLR